VPNPTRTFGSMVPALSALVLSAASGCGRSPVPDPGTSVAKTKTTAPTALVVAGCTDPLRGDSTPGAPLYVLDPASGSVSRWAPDGLPDAVLTQCSSATTQALFFTYEKPNEGPVLAALEADGQIRLVDPKPSRAYARMAMDGSHRMVFSENALQWRRLDGTLAHEIPLHAPTDRFFPSPDGEATVTQREDAVVIARRSSEVRLFEGMLLGDAAWSPDGKRLAAIVTKVTNGATPVDGATELWLLDADGTKPTLVALPARPQPRPPWSWIPDRRFATAAYAAAWAPDGETVAILSNHESECWSGGRDIPGGCEAAVYRVAASGTLLGRISPRAFRCGQLFWLRP